MKLFRGPKGKIIRRFGVNIFDSAKFDTLLERRPTPPGQHGANSRRGKPSEYNRQLVEKQKLKMAYGMTEKQFKNFYKKAANTEGAPGVNLMQSLEQRLDSVVYRAGFSSTKAHARQLVNHGHFLVNGKKVDIPSYLVKSGDEVAVKPKKSSQAIVKSCIEQTSSLARMPWISIDENNQKVTFNRLPERLEIPVIIQEQLIVELYSR